MVCLAAARAPAQDAAADTKRVIDAWLASQTNLQHWAADFVQTRTLQTLNTPLRATGQVWFATPDRFRWELGRPPQTVAVRQPAQVWILYPRLRRAERYPLGADASGPWKDAMALFDAGFPRDRRDLERRFRIAAVTELADHDEITLSPRSAQTRRFLPEIKLGIGKPGAKLLSTEMTFRDGSKVRNDFTNVLFNQPADSNRFEVAIPADWQVTEPATSRSAAPAQP